MISLQNKLRQLGEAFAELTDNAFHYYRVVKKTPWLVWAENGEENSFHSDNKKSCQTITGTVDLFTKTEFDSLADQVQDTLEALGAAWYLYDVQYEEETNLKHFTWHWEVSTRGQN